MRGIAWWLSWWVVLFWLWLAFAGEWNRIEWTAAAIAATAGATIVAIVRAQRELRFAFRAAWLRKATGIPRSIVFDCLVVLAELRRGRRSRAPSTRGRPAPWATPPRRPAAPPC
ncbi:MAG TPA: hypothetical protein VGJ25_13705 [Gaiellaceae bacterium]